MSRRHSDMRRPSPHWTWGEAIAALVGFLGLILLVLSVAIVLASLAHARWKPEYADLPQSVRDWYRTRELTPEAQKRFGFRSCCDHSDVVKTRFRVSAAGDEWWWLDGETWKRVPADIIHWGVRTPTGAPVMFAVGGRPTCFFPGGSDG